MSYKVKTFASFFHWNFFGGTPMALDNNVVRINFLNAMHSGISTWTNTTQLCANQAHCTFDWWRTGQTYALIRSTWTRNMSVWLRVCRGTAPEDIPDVCVKPGADMLGCSGIEVKSFRTLFHQFVELMSRRQGELDALVATGYKSALTEERRRYCFLVDRQCCVTKLLINYHSKVISALLPHPVAWQGNDARSPEDIFGLRLDWIALWSSHLAR